VLPPEALYACFDLTPYLAHVDTILARAGIARGLGSQVAAGDGAVR
jgi:hypothetical protein